MPNILQEHRLLNMPQLSSRLVTLLKFTYASTQIPNILVLIVASLLLSLFKTPPPPLHH